MTLLNKKFRIFSSVLVLSAVFSLLDRANGEEERFIQPPEKTGTLEFPYYFLAIHNEPANAFGAMDSQYQALRKIISKADEYNMKLTLMFGTTWVDFLLDPAHPERKKDLKKWKASGHEIAGHHHSIRHPGFWDGHSPLSREETEKVRNQHKRNPFDEKYQGTMKDFAATLEKLDPNIHSGCLNEESHKNVLPDTFTVLTGSGFANRGTVGTRKDDSMTEYGVNEYTLVGTVNGIERKWLSHSHAMRHEQIRKMKEVIGGMNGGVYGAVTHSLQDERVDQVTPFLELMEFLHEKDPEGRRSVTISTVVRNKIIPEKKISEKVLNETPPVLPSAERQMMDSGNHLNGLVAKFNMLLQKRKAEGADVSEAEKLDMLSRQALQNGKPWECEKILEKAIGLLESNGSQ